MGLFDFFSSSSNSGQWTKRVETTEVDLSEVPEEIRQALHLQFEPLELIEFIEPIETSNKNKPQVATNSQQFKTGVASRVDRIQQKMNELQAELDSLKSYIISYREDDYGNVYEMKAEQGADGSYHVVNERKLNANEIRNLKSDIRSKFKHAKNRY